MKEIYLTPLERKRRNLYQRIGAEVKREREKNPDLSFERLAARLSEKYGYTIRGFAKMAKREGFFFKKGMS